MKPLENVAVQKAAEQTSNNSTGWVGDVPGINKSMVKGQTFISGSEGDLQSIKVLPSVVSKPGSVVITLHRFDQQNKSWGSVLGSASVQLEQSDAGKWISFNMPGLHLVKGDAYGFRL